MNLAALVASLRDAASRALDVVRDLPRAWHTLSLARAWSQARRAPTDLDEEERALFDWLSRPLAAPTLTHYAPAHDARTLALTACGLRIRYGATSWTSYRETFDAKLNRCPLCVGKLRRPS